MQGILIIIAVLSVPWMLCLKPFVLRAQHNRKMMQNPSSAVEEDHHGGEDGEVNKLIFFIYLFYLFRDMTLEKFS